MASYVMGIDTGGTYTDGVLFDTESNKVLIKGKTPTTHKDLSLCIGECLSKLLKEADKMGCRPCRLLLSTTLATNTVAEGKLAPAGGIFIGREPRTEVPCGGSVCVRGRMNVKGREEQVLDEDAVREGILKMKDSVTAFAVVGYMSMRNPAHELRVKEIAEELTGLPVVCGSGLSPGPGFDLRCATALLNAGLFSAVNRFLQAVTGIMNRLELDIPVYMVKSDGTVGDLAYIRRHPLETVFSGPAAGAVGAGALTGLKSGIVCDMGGTTLDVCKMEEGRPLLAAEGGTVGGCPTLIPSAEVSTTALGGDSVIGFCEDGTLTVGPQRGVPLSRGGEDITPTDIQLLLSEDSSADCGCLKAAAEEKIKGRRESVSAFAEEAAEEVRGRLRSALSGVSAPPGTPVIAIGAPVKSWFRRGFEDKNVTVPVHHEVANAAGAAASGLYCRKTAVIRRGEDGYGYLLHTEKKRMVLETVAQAEQTGEEILRQLCEEVLQKQKGKDIKINFRKQTVTAEGAYAETRLAAEGTAEFDDNTERGEGVS